MAKQLTQREFLQVTALGAGAGLLAACVPAAPATGGGTLVFGYPQKTTYGNFCVPWNYAGTFDRSGSLLFGAGRLAADTLLGIDAQRR